MRRLLISSGIAILAFAVLLFCLIKGAGYVDYRDSRPLMGTLFSVHVQAPNDQAARDAVDRAFNAAEQLEQVLSAHRAGSELSALNDAPAGVPVKVSPELAKALATALHYAQSTDGAFDPTLGPCIRLWKRAVTRKALPSPDDLAKALAASGYRKLVVDGTNITKTVSGMRIDLGGIGKGMAADLIGRELDKAGITRFSISTTSDFLAGPPPNGKTGWSATYFPGGDSTQAKAIDLAQAALSSSGDGRQHVLIDGVYYSHIIDPTTGLGLQSLKPCSSVTIKAPAATEADALSTACRVLTPEQRSSLLKRFGNAEQMD